MNRLRDIVERYGWRTPFVVFVIAFSRLDAIRQIVYLNWLRLTTKGQKGRNIFFGQQIIFVAGSSVDLGDNLYLGSRCAFEISVNPFARVTIGSNTWISHDCHIGCSQRIVIGSNVLIGEFVSIRDSMHAYDDISSPIKNQRDVLGTITIEDDVWVGRGTLVQGRPEGVVIGHGAVIGANSVVTRSIAPFSVVAGAPARPVRMRNGK